jgi:hypothetical protein
MKGAVMREFVRWYARRVPAPVLRDIWDELPDSARLALDLRAEAFGVLPSTWYDAAVFHALIDAILRRVPEAERDALLREGTRAGMEASARGVYRWVFGKLSPELYARNIQRLWSLVHDTGTREIVMTSPTTAISTTRDWPGHHPSLCTSTLEAMCSMLEMMGCRGVRAERTQCISDGSPSCVARVSWSDA